MPGWSRRRAARDPSRERADRSGGGRGGRRGSLGGTRLVAGRGSGGGGRRSGSAGMYVHKRQPYPSAFHCLLLCFEPVLCSTLSTTLKLLRTTAQLPCCAACPSRRPSICPPPPPYRPAVQRRPSRAAAHGCRLGGQVLWSGRGRVNRCFGSSGGDGGRPPPAAGEHGSGDSGRPPAAAGSGGGGSGAAAGGGGSGSGAAAGQLRLDRYSSG